MTSTIENDASHPLLGMFSSDSFNGKECYSASLAALQEAALELAEDSLFLYPLASNYLIEFDNSSFAPDIVGTVVEHDLEPGRSSTRLQHHLLLKGVRASDRLWFTQGQREQLLQRRAR